MPYCCLRTAGSVKTANTIAFPRNNVFWSRLDPPPLQANRTAIGHEQWTPDHLHAALSKGHLAVISPQQSGTLRNRQRVADDRIKYVLGHGRDGLPEQIRTDAGDESGRDDRTRQDFVGRCRRFNAARCVNPPVQPLGLMSAITASFSADDRAGRARRDPARISAYEDQLSNAWLGSVLKISPRRTRRLVLIKWSTVCPSSATTGASLHCLRRVPRD